MSLTTFSKFYYGFDITSSNNLIDFDEGSGEITATLVVDSYTATEFAAALEVAMNAVGDLTYTVTFNRTTQKLVIAADGNFSLLPETGTNIATAPWDIMGFTVDVDSAATYTSDGLAGSQYTPQFILQDHVPTSQWKESRFATVNKTATGRVELINFGQDQFLQCNIKYVTDIAQPSGGPITNNASGYSNLISFMDYLITKGPVEYMADVSTPATFEKLVLESTVKATDGTGYKLKEMYDQNLPLYYETGTLVFKVVE
jgi:hypothetical protein